MRARLAAAAATMTAPRTFHDQAGLASSGLAAISASTGAATAACSVGSLVSVPAAAAAMTAPTPAQNHAPPWIGGRTDTAARRTPAAAARFTWARPGRAGEARGGGGPGGAAARRGWAGRARRKPPGHRDREAAAVAERGEARVKLAAPGRLDHGQGVEQHILEDAGCAQRPGVRNQLAVQALAREMRADGRGGADRELKR